MVFEQFIFFLFNFGEFGCIGTLPPYTTITSTTRTWRKLQHSWSTYTKSLLIFSYIPCFSFCDERFVHSTVRNISWNLMSSILLLTAGDDNTKYSYLVQVRARFYWNDRFINQKRKKWQLVSSNTIPLSLQR